MYISSNLSTSKESVFQSTPQRRKVTILKFKFNIYYVTPGISLFIFSRCNLCSLTDLWSTFYENKGDLFDEQCLLSSAIDKKERDTWKLHSKITQWKAQCMVHQNNMKITVTVYRCQNKLTCRIAEIVWIYVTALLTFYICFLCQLSTWLVFKICWEEL